MKTFVIKGSWPRGHLFASASKNNQRAFTSMSAPRKLHNRSG